MNKLKDIRTSIILMPDPLKEHRKMMTSFSGPMEDFRASLAIISDPFKGYQKMTDFFPNPIGDFRSSLAIMLDPFKEHKKMTDFFSNPIGDFRSSLAIMSDPFKEHQKMTTSFLGPMEDFRASLAMPSNLFSVIQNSASLKYIRDIAIETQPDITTDDTISLSTKRITATELQELSNTIFRDASLARLGSLEESINNLVNEMRSQKDPLIQKILIYFIYPLIVITIASFTNPLIEYHVKSHPNPDKRVLVKKLKLGVNSVIDNRNALSAMRYVSTDILNVRAFDSIKSKTIGHLYFSSVVLVIEKKKNWILIEWNDSETSAQVTGWVFSKYLAKFQ